MANGYTYNIFSGKDLSVDHYIIDIAREFGFLFSIRDEKYGIYDRDEIIKLIKQNSSVSDIKRYAKLKENIKYTNELFDSLQHTEIPDFIDKSLKNNQIDIDSIYPKSIFKNLDEIKQKLSESEEAATNNKDNLEYKILVEYYSDLLEAKTAKCKLDYLDSLSKEKRIEVQNKCKEIEISKKEHKLARNKELINRYDTMLNEIENWEAPKDLINIKTTAARYITESKDFDCSPSEKLHAELLDAKNKTPEYYLEKVYDNENDKYRFLSVKVLEVQEVLNLENKTKK